MDLNRIFMKNACPTKVGGQAILEGLMMRGSRAIAVAIRQPDGNIHLNIAPVKAAGAWKKIPVIRGIGSFISSLVTGTTVLMQGADTLERLIEEDEARKAAEKAAADADCKTGGDSAGIADNGAGSEPCGGAADGNEKKQAEKKGGFSQAAVLLSVALSLVIVVGLFILLPTFLIGLIKKAGVESVVLLNLFEGIIRICLFIGYIFFCRAVPDVRRTFEYHGAEHKTIHCFENGLELTPENAQSFYTLHPRCGTSFLMFVMVISLIVFSLFGWPNVIVRVVLRLVLIPVIAGLSYEVLQWTGRHDFAFAKMISVPGIMLQKLTTCEPSLDQLEVAIAAMNAVLPSHNDPELAVDYWAGVLFADGRLVKNEAETEEYRTANEK